MSIAAKHSYRELFLNSEQWKDIRWRKLKRDGSDCDICGIADVLNDAHHVFYPRRWEDTSSGDLVVLCRKCHEKVHLFGAHKQGTQSEAWARYIEVKEKIRSRRSFPLPPIDTVPTYQVKRCEKVFERERYRKMMERLFKCAGKATERTNFNFRKFLREKLKEAEHKNFK